MPKKKQTGTGPRWIGDQPRKRYNVVLDPDVKKRAQEAAKAEGISFSMWIERAAQVAMKDRDEITDCQYIKMMHLYDAMKPLTSKQFKNLRTSLGLSQTGLANRLERSLPTIQRWEAGTHPIPPEIGLAMTHLETLLSIEQLKEAIYRAEDESGRYASEVQVPIRFARRFCGWGPDDWHEHLGEWFSRKECGTIADDFFRRGGKALEKLKFGLISLRVASRIEEDVEQVTILKGIPTS